MRASSTTYRALRARALKPVTLDAGCTLESPEELKSADAWATLSLMPSEVVCGAALKTRLLKAPLAARMESH